jgi:hypothetical protein
MRVESPAMTNYRLTLAVLASTCCLSLACLDQKATYEPRSGTWSYEEEAVVSNNCDSQVASNQPNLVPMTFNLDYDEGDEFQIEQGEDDVLCEIDRETFTCVDYTVGPSQILTFDAFITVGVRWEGEFTSDEIADGRATSAITCTGDDCDLVPNLPCSRTVTFTAEFVN